jgi:hypothetical protein
MTDDCTADTEIVKIETRTEKTVIRRCPKCWWSFTWMADSWRQTDLDCHKDDCDGTLFDRIDDETDIAYLCDECFTSTREQMVQGAKTSDGPISELASHHLHRD